MASKGTKDEQFHKFLANSAIKWQFNLSRAPWWGGQLKRLIGLFKSVFNKLISNAILQWAELEEVVIYVEVALNNRPLGYLEDDVELPVTCRSWELEADKDLRKRAKFDFIMKCKEVMWKLWTREYLRSLRQQHRQVGGEQTCHPGIGDIVIVKGGTKTGTFGSSESCPN